MKRVRSVSRFSKLLNSESDQKFERDIIIEQINLMKCFTSLYSEQPVKTNMVRCGSALRVREVKGQHWGQCGVRLGVVHSKSVPLTNL